MFGLPATFTIGFMVAGLTELIQHFNPTRSGEWRDIGIDYLGYAIGTTITLIVFIVIYFINKATNKKKSND